MQPTSEHLYLIHKDQNGRESVRAHFEGDHVEFNDTHMQTVMKQIGIQIPPDSRGEFEERSVVYLNDGESALFKKAFLEVYFPLHLPKNEYFLSENAPITSNNPPK